jgi:hypothetical protein
LLLVPAVGLAAICQLTLTGPSAAAGAAAPGTTVATGAVAPNPVNNLDCNGWSKKYTSVHPSGRATCTDPLGREDGKIARFEDNGHYVGHDEPSVKFISHFPSSGYDMSYIMKMPRDPAAAPTPSGSVTNYGQLSVAPWFGLALCDPKSYPQNPCTPRSDTNSGAINDPNGAGSAFMELQFYPPGFTPLNDGASCDPTKWCAALNIDSLSCTFGFATCNNNCIEPVNFAFLQTNGVPAGPPSPQLTNENTFTPNAHTLKINPGDVVETDISDPPQGFTTVVKDLTTHQVGFMTASAANGFMNTNIADCSGTPFTFHAEYNTAAQQNQTPWAALEGGVLMQQEIGHSEVCASLANKHAANFTYPGGQSYSDPNIYDTCVGGSEGNGSGEGPCNAQGICQNATTQGPNGPVACSTNDSNSGALCEFADGYCLPKGTRTALVNGVPTTESSRANQCYQNRFQNGDLDFEGLDYVHNSWPNGSPNHPTSFQYLGPFQLDGKPYPQVQFETNVAASENLCNVATGAGCTAPPIGAQFYPYWSLGVLGSGQLGNHSASCAWNFGEGPPITVRDFGKDAEYGVPDVARFGGTLTSAVIPNPQFTGRCQ